MKPDFRAGAVRTSAVDTGRPVAPARAGRGREVVGRVLLAGLILFITAVVHAGWELRAEKAYNMHNLVRLHVVANSDGPADQALKLEVRDAILRVSGDLFTARAPEDATSIIRANLATFEEAARDVVREAGSDYPVRAEFGVFAFPERTYGPLVLRAGDYPALRVVLGDGQGTNWWCILFPPLCFLDVVGGGPDAARKVAAGDGSSGAARVVSLRSLSPEERRDLERVLERVLERTRAGGAQPGGAPTHAAGGAGGVGLLVAVSTGSGALVDLGFGDLGSGNPGSGDVSIGALGFEDADLDDLASVTAAGRDPAPDSGYLVLVADTGNHGLEVRLFVVERFRELMRALARAFPWLFREEGSAVGLGGANPDR